MSHAIYIYNLHIKQIIFKKYKKMITSTHDVMSRKKKFKNIVDTLPTSARDLAAIIIPKHMR